MINYRDPFVIVFVIVAGAIAGAMGIAQRRALPPPLPSVSAVSMPAASTPPTGIDVSINASIVWQAHYENRTPDSPATATFDHLGVRVDVATDAAFTNVLASVEIDTPDATLAAQPFDGLVDWAGASGRTFFARTSAQIVSTSAVSDPAPFLVPWTLHVRAVPLASAHASASGAPSLELDPFGAVDVALSYR